MTLLTRCATAALALTLTAGFRHLPRTQGWPVMSTDWKTIHIKPYTFSTRNPALTIAQER